MTLLFSTIELRDIRLKNRIVIPPMHQYAGDSGFPNDWHLINAGKFAIGGAGLVIIESTKVERRGSGTVGDLGLWHDKFIPAFRMLADVINRNGAVAGIQIGHSGRKARMSRPWEGNAPLLANPGVDDWHAWELVAPSALPPSAKAPTPRALDLGEMPVVIDAWGQAARRADAAGFQVLEIHAAHGYLIHQFLSERSNMRTDRYGGSEQNRMRFALEIVENVRTNWPSNKPLFMRLSCEDDGGWGPNESVRLARLVKAAGVDVIDCSSGGMSGGSTLEAQRASRYGYQVPYAEQIRREADIKTMAVGHIVHADQAEAILANGQADLIAVGREAMNNPNWPMDAAQKLGVDPDFAKSPSAIGYWLAKRSKSKFEGTPSTWQKGIEP